MDYQTEFDEQQYRGKLNRRFISGILVGCFVALFISAAACMAYLFTFNAPVAQNTASGDSVLSDETLTKINKIESVIDSNFYKTDVSSEAKANGLYKGLMDSLDDPYSVYYTEDELTELMNDTAGIYYGIGAYVSMDQTTSLPRISGVIEGTPAEEAGLQTDDIIYEVDKQSTQGLELSEVVSLIKGEEGTTVHLTILRGSDLEEIEVDVMRAQVSVPTVKTKVMDDGVGYLQITEFDEVTPDQFTEGMAELRANDIKGLIIDLRSNPGGSLTAVCDIARQLLPKGTIVYTVDRDGNREDYTCDGTHEIDIPVVVLVNKYSASASEILSGAIKDYGIGTLVGTTTYGKGIVQRIFDLKDGTAIKLTVSNYYTPNGNDIHGVGIDPDVEIEFDADAYAEDKTDNQLDKAVEVLKEAIEDLEEKAG
ncbi:carboxyl-terminal processing protease [Butyrivibrio sp. Su6]|uniref:S41 family peptidase n=1 Tax=Butyrivibrio sp. Su6 TaxID=1520810 RepID=UPI00089E21A4|nr:S41 family peptidase [Butyrivibrio sp. Su6]SEG21095.1 carboxyl-terminal processing protease [Butyrivibrio sp. Su6]